MQIVCDVASWFDWALKHHSEVKEGDVSLPSHHGEQFRLVRQLREEPNVVQIHLPDSDVDRMVADHAEAVRTATQGYTAIHQGGSADGQEVVVPPRSVPSKSRDKLIAEHLGNTVLPQHCHSHHITGVHVVGGYRSPDGEEEDPAKLERYLNRQLVEDAAGDGTPAPSRSRRKAEETQE